MATELARKIGIPLSALGERGIPPLAAACVSALDKPSEDWSWLRLTEQIEEAVWRCDRKAQTDAGRQISAAQIVTRALEILLG